MLGPFSMSKPEMLIKQNKIAEMHRNDKGHTLCGRSRGEILSFGRRLRLACSPTLYVLQRGAEAHLNSGERVISHQIQGFFLDAAYVKVSIRP